MELFSLFSWNSFWGWQGHWCWFIDPCWGVFYSEIFSTELLHDFCPMQVGEEVERALQNITPKVGSRWVIGHWSLLSSQYLHALCLLTLESHESSDHCANFQFVMSLVLPQLFSHAAWPKNCGNPYYTSCVHKWERNVTEIHLFMSYAGSPL